ncbi:tryptophanyl-tRNA synthetase domain protein [[Clostridium] sordellii ATCC 9714]|nr:tryptophanyl-tRNA synthetase domain protein [[Clostridium] sordellii ATCC 9714] [Paeniclostridium sordellii ATCC 9714]
MYEGRGYGDFKNDVSEVIIETLKPLREKYEYLLANKDYLENIYAQGAQKSRISSKKNT